MAFYEDQCGRGEKKKSGKRLMRSITPLVLNGRSANLSCQAAVVSD